MKITERQITEKQLEEMTNLMVDDKVLMGLPPLSTIRQPF